MVKSYRAKTGPFFWPSLFFKQLECKMSESILLLTRDYRLYYMRRTSLDQFTMMQNRDDFFILQVSMALELIYEYGD